jgi:hypothetical protein
MVLGLPLNYLVVSLKAGVSTVSSAKKQSTHPQNQIGTIEFPINNNLK